jgi:DNA polymerase-3 subunit gamma/tau
LSLKVLALKYRPKNFSELVGQTSVSKTLKLALNNNRLGHAYLFSGLRGSGKTSTARIFAKALLCETGVSDTPCEVCKSCESANNGSNIDIIEMDAASNRKIDDIRGLIEQTKYRPSSSRFKIFIIDEVHMLTKEAFNALLKTLEEPPDYIKFILATTDPLNLPSTVLSRVQHFHFKRIDFDDILKHLEYIMSEESIEFELEALKIIIRNGNGSLRDTLTLLEQAVVFSPEKLTQENVIAMLGLIDPTLFHQLFDAIFSKNSENILQYVKNLSNYEPEMVLDETIQFLKEQLFVNKNNRFNTFVVQKYFEILNESKRIISISNDNEFILTLTFFKMSEYSRLSEIEKLLKFLEQNPKVSVQQLENIDFTSVEKPKEPEKLENLEQKIAPEPKQISKPIDKFYSLLNFITQNENKNITVETVTQCLKQNVKINFSKININDHLLTFETCFKDNEECKNIIRFRYTELRHFLILSFAQDGVMPKFKHEFCQADEPKNVQKTQAEEIKASDVKPVEEQIKEIKVENLAPNNQVILNPMDEPVIQNLIKIFNLTENNIKIYDTNR